MNDSIPLYGSQNNTYSQTTWTHGIGKRNYELTNHLGNVLSVISDKVIEHGTGGATTPGTVVDYFLADILQSTDYSAFGVQLSGRNFTKTGVNRKYKRGYQGSEMDNEVHPGSDGLATGNSYTTEFRQLDPRLGRWLSIDPKMSAWESPYVSMGNNPILYNDPLGDTIRLDPSFEKRPLLMLAYLLWTQTDQGKTILTDYGIGGKYEHISVIMKGVDGLDYGDRGETRTYEKNRKTGKSVKELTPNSYLDYPIQNGKTLAKGKDKSNYLCFNITMVSDEKNLTQKLIFGVKREGLVNGKVADISDKNYTYHAELARTVIAIMHEWQHLSIEMEHLLNNSTMPTADQQHDEMAKPSWSNDRKSEFLKLKDMWKSDCIDRVKNGEYKNEEEYIKSRSR